ncbi:MAG: C40 family peptidase [Archangiaceae bacterium]|nr:C40 family peptidase [Archangiaceae bacterium]
MRGRFLFCVTLCACATAPVREDAPIVWDDFPHPQAPEPDPLGARIAAHADALVGIRSLKTVTHLPDDCTGLVRYAYSKEGLELMPPDGVHGSNGVTAIWSGARAKNALLRTGAPAPGDLVFFRQTYDRDRDGRLDDGLTHIGVVESVEPDGTVVFVHRSGQGVTRGRVNAAHPQDQATNDWLRMRSRRAPAALTGELLAGFASAEILSR